MPEIEQRAKEEITLQHLERLDILDIVGGQLRTLTAPSVTEELTVTDAAYQDALDASTAAAEAGDFDLALKRFREALYRQEIVRTEGTATAERFELEQLDLPLVGGGSIRDLQTKEFMRTGVKSGATQLPRRIRRALSRGKE